jgi:hypothetical protein
MNFLIHYSQFSFISRLRSVTAIKATSLSFPKIHLMSPSFYGHYGKVAHTLKSLWSCTDMTAGTQDPLQGIPDSWAPQPAADSKVSYTEHTPQFRGWQHRPNLVSKMLCEDSDQWMAWVVSPTLSLSSSISDLHFIWFSFSSFFQVTHIPLH